MTGIYKVTNNQTKESYIGQAEDIQRRWNQHKSPTEWARQPDHPMYKEMKDIGVKNFAFEVIEECPSEQLAERERYWVKYYDTYYNGYNRTPGGQTNYGDNHPNHKLELQDVINIRTRYNNRERKKEVYLDYSNRIGETGFGKIWKGETWKGTMMEVYTPENKEWHKHNTGNEGSSNGRARLNEQDVYNIRLRKKQGELVQEVYKDYQDKLTYGSFKNVWSYQNWKNIVV